MSSVEDKVVVVLPLVLLPAVMPPVLSSRVFLQEVRIHTLKCVQITASPAQGVSWALPQFIRETKEPNTIKREETEG